LEVIQKYNIDTGIWQVLPIARYTGTTRTAINTDYKQILFILLAV